MINEKLFEHRPIDELMAIVKDQFKKFNAEALFDDSILVPTVLWCNDKLGMPIREIREVAIPVVEYKAKLPLDFEKLYYVCALQATNTITHNLKNPFDNSFDQDIIYEANLDRESLGCVDNYQVTIKKETTTTVHNYGTWVQLDVSPSSKNVCHIDCPNTRKSGTYTINIEGEDINTPFRSGTLYLMYIGMMKDIDGNITFPFNPLITPFYKWKIIEDTLETAMFNSDATNLGELYKLSKQNRLAAWLDAFNITMEREYGDYVKSQRKKELGWYHQYFRYFQN